MRGACPCLAIWRRVVFQTGAAAVLCTTLWLLPALRSPWRTCSATGRLRAAGVKVRRCLRPLLGVPACVPFLPPFVTQYLFLLLGLVGLR
jgi:hypothetical protein